MTDYFYLGPKQCFMTCLIFSQPFSDGMQIKHFTAHSISSETPVSFYIRKQNLGRTKTFFTS